MTDADALRANLLALAREQARHLAGAAVVERAWGAWTSSGVPLAPMNTVVRVEGAADGVDGRVEEVCAWYAERGLPFGCWVLDRDAPGDVEKRLLDRGFALVARESAMEAPLGVLAREPLPRGVEISQVSPRDADRFVDTMVAAFGSPREEAPLWRAATAVPRPAWPLAHWIATEGAREIGTATAFLHDGTVGVYNVGTVPEARRRGIGRALTLRALLDARDRGARRAVLLASSLGKPVYEALGFRETEPVTILGTPTG